MKYHSVLPIFLKIQLSKTLRRKSNLRYLEPYIYVNRAFKQMIT